MALKAARIDRFGGLDLASDQADTTSAIDGLNFDLPRDLSYVRSRPGFTRLSGIQALTGDIALWQVAQRNSQRLLTLSYIDAGATTTVYLDAVSTGGALTALGNWTIGANPPTDAGMLCYGTDVNDLVFILTGSGALLRKLTGTSTLAASVGRPRFLGVTANSNRLIQAGFYAAADSPTGANGSLSCVFFSDPGAPETFGANSFEQLRPGDGEDICGLATWRGQTFVFKRSAMFVFGPEGTEPDGSARFDYRQVDLPATVWGANSQAVVAGRDGVYFLTSKGVYRTTGGVALKVSANLDPAFDDALGLAYLTRAGDRVLLVVDDTSLVYLLDEDSGQWLRWSIPQTLAPVADFSLLGSRRDFTLLTANGTVLYLDDDATTDDGAILTAYWQSGFSDLGEPGRKTVAVVELWGTGSVNYSLAADYANALPTVTLTLGTAPQAALATSRRAVRGARHSLFIDAPDLPWRLNSATLYQLAPAPAPATR